MERIFTSSNVANPKMKDFFFFSRAPVYQAHDWCQPCIFPRHFIHLGNLVLATRYVYGRCLQRNPWINAWVGLLQIYTLLHAGFWDSAGRWNVLISPSLFGFLSYSSESLKCQWDVGRGSIPTDFSSAPSLDERRVNHSLHYHEGVWFNYHKKSFLLSWCDIKENVFL